MLSDKINFLDAFNPKALASMIAGKSRERRLTAGLTQQELAKKSGVSLGTLKRFENLHEISLKHLLMIAVALHCTEGFDLLFPPPQAQRLDDVIKSQHEIKRQRGRKKL